MSDSDFELKLKDVLKRALVDAKSRHQHPFPSVPPKLVKSRKNPLNIFLELIIIAIISTPTITYSPSKPMDREQKGPKYYQIDNAKIEITVKAASADDLPNIRIGPGFSFYKVKKTIQKYLWPK